ncbi:aminotransferase class V-fold PLP-dependent enzyme [Microcoleus sp. FACHB-68]|uniref:aminotransferase class V-fold PLP-dependent enzyme n=1 Tax=Microcoleus sp. FACHB-68 TaxID=2692826 RepID=UPI0016847E85|nr:aminotransferase class V-fold PLP-dependent enzyme [Microcoleus sp. FACHB-68]MBD1938236.1 aminotransferase class V-fold PLP-dependent enzyme [Microcoleus sp. FACHB-68]
MTGSTPVQTSLEDHRQHFPALVNKAYFNYGGQGPLPQAALEAIRQSYEEVERVGPFSGEANAWLGREATQTRQAIATELCVPAETITLTEDVTVGCNIALWGFDWKPGDHLLLTDCEHQGIVAAVGELQRRFDIEVSTCPLMATLNDGDPVAAIDQYLRSNTRLVVLSHILWNTGQVLPLAEIVQLCHNHSTWGKPVRVLVDAAQSVGVLPLNLTEIAADFYAFTGHKWWCGPAGVGGLYVQPEALESLHPTFIGWRGIITDGSGQPAGWQPTGKRFEIATSAVPLYAGLRSAMALHHQWGSTEERYQQIQKVSKYLWEQLQNLDGINCLRTSPPEAGLISFQLDSTRQDAGVTHQQLVQFLESQKIMVRTLLNPHCIRACVHYFTLESEIDQLVAGISDFKV